MEYRRLGDSELRVSVVGLGTLALGGRSYRAVSEEMALATVQRTVDLGINFIDTSDNYGFGRAEVLIGQAIRGRRDDVLIATKGGTPWDKEGRTAIDCSAAAITEGVEASLRRLGTDWIDLYQIHVPDPETPYEETVGALERLKEAGKIRYAGLSNFWVEELDAWLAADGVVSNQMPYNFLHRDIEAELLPYCRQRSVGVIAYTPLLMGVFAGRISPETVFAEGDHRASYPQFQGRPLRDSLALVARLQSLAADTGLTMAQLALSWVVSRPGITCAIPGATSPEQVEENAVAGERSLAADLMERIDRLLADTEVETPRTIPMKVVEIKEPAGRRLGILEIGVKVPVPSDTRAGDVVEMDIVTGQVSEWVGEAN